MREVAGSSPASQTKMLRSSKRLRIPDFLSGDMGSSPIRSTYGVFSLTGKIPLCE